MKLFALVAAVLFVIGAIGTATDSHEAFGQDAWFWLLLGLAAFAIDVATSIVVGRPLRRAS